MTRKFSLEDDFMNLTIDDMVYGYIQHMATFAPELKKLYVCQIELNKDLIICKVSEVKEVC